MTLTIDQLCNRLAPRFGTVERIGPTVVRFTRKAGNRDFAVCYVDIGSQLPSSPEALDEYQDRVVGRYFFDGPKSLQWSNYLFFVLSPEQIDTGSQQSNRLFIERDRKYARKFVIADSELETSLAPAVIQATDQPVGDNILTTWINCLAEANLDRAVLNNETLPRRLELIEQLFGSTPDELPSGSFARTTSVQPFIRSLELDRFRAFPIRKEFTFGSVNLICGANGSGKTSLLEAVELSYCGKTKRNPTANDEYCIKVVFADGTRETATHRRTPATFKERNLLWYGQSDVRSSTVHQSFSQFNFLNTDAAVALAEAKEDLEETLSKLLVGPETAKTWKEIQRTSEKLAEKIKELSAVRQRVELDLLAVKRQLNTDASAKKESDSLLTKLQAMIKSVGWRLEDGPAGETVAAFVATLSETDAVINQVISIDLAKSPATIENIETFLQEGQSRCSRVEKSLERIALLQGERRKFERTISQLDGLLATASEFLQYVEAEFPKKLEDLRALESRFAQCRSVLDGISRDVVDALPTEVIEQTLSDWVKTVESQRQSAQANLAASQKNYSEFSALRDATTKLAQEMRSVANRLMQQTKSINTCPLCHTKFAAGELAKHMQQGLDLALESDAKTLLDRVKTDESNLAEAVRMEDAAKWLLGYCDRSEYQRTARVSTVIVSLTQTRSDGNSVAAQLKKLRQSLSSLESDGLSAERFRQLQDQFASISPDFDNKSPSEIRSFMEDTAASIVIEKQNLRVVNEEYAVLQQGIEREFDLPFNSNTPTAGALANLKKRLATATSLYAKMVLLLKSLPWPRNSSLSDLRVTIQSVRAVAGDFQSTIAKENAFSAIQGEAIKKKDQLETQLAGLVPRINRLAEALDVFTEIQEQHSLTQGMQAALRQNRVAIESIFARIHSPAEFTGLGNSLTTLVRKVGGVDASLQQISTGQRAAFALSLFLAQNAQLRTAPPIILIDDPIAHVDDLNCLSFLDYLREIVVSGGRQIIFATANDKLATLFERKFDFLGTEDFRRYDLSR